jgi:hypothetical protein
MTTRGTVATDWPDEKNCLPEDERIHLGPGAMA